MTVDQNALQRLAGSTTGLEEVSQQIPPPALPPYDGPVDNTPSTAPTSPPSEPPEPSFVMPSGQGPPLGPMGPSFGEPSLPPGPHPGPQAVLRPPHRSGASSAQRRGAAMGLIGALAVIVVLMSVPLAYGVFLSVQTLRAPERPIERAELGTVLSQDDKPSAAVSVEPEPAPVEVEPEEPEPEPEPEKPTRTASAAAPPKAPTPRSVSALVAQGWSQVGGNPGAAERTFKAALDQSPGHPEASYGYGYALLQQRRAADARPHLCRAKRATRNQEEVRELTMLLANNNLSCD